MWIGSIRGRRAASSEETSPSPSTARVGSSAPPARTPAPRKPRAASVEDSRTSVAMEALEEGDEEEETGSIDRRHAARMQRAATVEDSRGGRGDGGAGKATGGRRRK